MTTSPLPLPAHLAALGWLRTPGRHAQAQLALPTDLFMVTVHCSHDPRPSNGSQWGAALELTVTLLRTRPERFRSSAQGELAFALLTPVGLLALLRAPLRGGTDQRLPLAQFCAADELQALRGALLKQPAAATRLRVFGAWIEGRIKQRHHFGRQQQRVAEAATLMQQERGLLDVADVRDSLHVSQRQLERDFSFWLGVSPSVYARVVRFQHAAMALAGGNATTALSDIAADHGFADQSHMNRTFRQLSWMTPRDFVQAADATHHAARRALAGRMVVVEAPRRTSKNL